MNTTKVIFRMMRGEIIALFPADAGNSNPSTCSSYMHIGQHGAADPALVVEYSRLATRKEYAPLATELSRIGYRLRIATRCSRSDYYTRRAQILKTA